MARDYSQVKSTAVRPIDTGLLVHLPSARAAKVGSSPYPALVLSLRVAEPVSLFSACSVSDLSSGANFEVEVHPRLLAFLEESKATTLESTKSAHWRWQVPKAKVGELSGVVSKILPQKGVKISQKSTLLEVSMSTQPVELANAVPLARAVLDIAEARTKRFPVLTTGALPWRSKLSDLLARSATLIFDPATPGLVELLTGENYPKVKLQSPLTIAQALDSLSKAGYPWTCDGAFSPFLKAELATSDFLSHPLPLLPWQQLMAARMACDIPGAVCASPAGSGKTVASAAVVHVSNSEKVLILAPKATLDQWVKELALHCPNREVITTGEGLDKDGSFILVATPNALDRHGAAWLNLNLDLLIIDEADWVTRSSARASLAWNLRKTSKKALVLTGTPDRPRLLSDFALGVPPASQPKKGTKPPTPKSSSVVALELGPCWIAGSPPPQKVDGHLVSLPCSKEELALSRKLASLLKGATPLESQRLRTNLAWHLISELSSPSSKQQWLLSTIAAEVAAGERVLCFFNSVKAMHYLEERLQERGLDVASLDGNSKNPAALASAFRDEKLKILLVGPSSQRGLNLQGASVVLHGDLPLDLNQYQQRNARAARIGGKDQIRALVPVLVPSLEVALVKQIGIPGSDKLNQVGSSE